MVQKECLLSTNDSAVLEQLFDPESAPTPSPIVIDASLPSFPHISSHQSFTQLRSLGILAIRAAEANDVLKALSLLSQAIAQEPKYASAYNNRAQVYRMQAAMQDPASRDNVLLSSTVLNAYKDLTKAIDLAAPPSPTAAISPQQAKLLANAHTQRATLLYTTSKYLQTAKDNGQIKMAFKKLPSEFKAWDDINIWEETASRDFFWGGRYGNEVAKAMAVHTNPYAKLCGSIVKEAMKKEMGEGLRQAGVY